MKAKRFIFPLMFISAFLLSSCTNKEPQLTPKEKLIDYIKWYDGGPNGYHTENEYICYFVWQPYGTETTIKYQVLYNTEYDAFSITYQTDLYLSYKVTGVVSFEWGSFALADFRGSIYNKSTAWIQLQIQLNDIKLEEYPSFSYGKYTVLQCDDEAPYWNDLDEGAEIIYTAIKDGINKFYSSFSSDDYKDIKLW